MSAAIDGTMLMERLQLLGSTGLDAAGRLCRVAATDADKAGRDLFCTWLKQSGLEIRIDRIGNIYGVWSPEGSSGDPVVMGSHIDTVIDAGIYDGCYGVLSGLAVIEALKETGAKPRRPLAVAAFTNEEGVRFSPDMMGSLVAAGGLDVETALSTLGTDGKLLGQELARIGYAGREQPGFLKPHAYVELHIEQGPVLEAEGVALGAVENLQGISWQKIIISGTANHAGTTPMTMRRDAGVAAARVIAHLDAHARKTPGAVATVGTVALEPCAINVIPAKVTFTVDMRNPDETMLQASEAALADFLELLRHEGYGIESERLARFEPVTFSQDIVSSIENAAQNRQISCRRMTSGAGHDAQMMARVAPAAMIFVPSRAGISHNPQEFTDETSLIRGANVLLDVVNNLVSQ